MNHQMFKSIHLDLAFYLLIFTFVLRNLMTMQDVTNALILDAMGQPCPMPLLLLKRNLKRQPEQLMLLKSSDPHSRQDVSRYCQIQGLYCEIHEISPTEFHYLISKAK